jgi:hypothetical protein
MQNLKTKKCLFNTKTFTLAGSFALLLLPVVVLADTCSYQEQIAFSVPSANIAKLDVSAGAGSLSVSSSPSATDISVSAVVCASRKSGLEDMGIGQVVQGDTQYLWTKINEKKGGFFSNGYAFINVEVIVPAGMPVDIKDGSGDLSVSGTGDLNVVDGSGDTQLFAIAGNVKVKDGSGELTIEDVQGNVDVDDGSGEIDIAKVTGAVIVRDGSGDIDVREVQLEVTILEDGSGDVNIDQAARQDRAAAQVSVNQ